MNNELRKIVLLLAICTNTGMVLGGDTGILAVLKTRLRVAQDMQTHYNNRCDQALKSCKTAYAGKKTHLSMQEREYRSLQKIVRTHEGVVRELEMKVESVAEALLGKG